MPYKDPAKKREANRRAKAEKRAAAKAEEPGKKGNAAVADVKARAWTFIVYPESAPENWREVLDGFHVPWACSPLHDKDVNATGEPKKPHWHILLSFSGKKAYKQIWSVSEGINGTCPQVCHDQKGLIRYFSHRDNPEKAQYDQRDIEAHGGFDLEEYLKSTASECMKLQDEMIEWCFKYHITEFWVLKVYALRERPDWSAELSRSCFQITQFLKSRRHSAGIKACNPETGEIYE